MWFICILDWIFCVLREILNLFIQLKCFVNQILQKQGKEKIDFLNEEMEHFVNIEIEKQGRQIDEKVKRRRLLYKSLFPTSLTEEINKNNFDTESDDDDIEFIDATDCTDVRQSRIYELEVPIEIDDEIKSGWKIDRIMDMVGQDEIKRCRLRRENRGLYSFYRLFTEEKKFLIGARKCVLNKFGSFVISKDKEVFAKEADSYVGELCENLISKMKSYTIFKDESCVGRITYENNLMKWNKLRKMTVTIQVFGENVVYENKTPEWSHVKGIHVLNFDGGRVKKKSKKNFMITRHCVSGEKLVLQFGKVTRDSFILDYSYPLCQLQAFAIALSTFHQ